MSEVVYEVHPAGHRVLVKVEKVEEKTEGGIYIPEHVREREERLQEIGTIVAIGPTAFDDYGGLDKWGLKPGDKVLFSRSGGKEIRYPGVEDGLRVLNDEDIIAVIS